MSVSFDPSGRSVRIRIVVVGPRRSLDLWCAVDTGATLTVLPAAILQRLGCDLSRPTGYTWIRSATGIARVPVIRVSALAALGRVRTDFLVAAHDLPLGVEADGLLGLDFLRGFVLTLDFARGRASLRPRRWWRFWR
jgi:hypothetical protein